MTAPEIRHQSDRNRFVYETGTGEEAVITYRLHGDTVDFDHTFVPDSARGKGIASRLVDAAAAWAREQGYRITASCSYARAYLRLPQ